MYILGLTVSFLLGLCIIRFWLQAGFLRNTAYFWALLRYISFFKPLRLYRVIRPLMWDLKCEFASTAVDIRFSE
jgi:hypothetical protein